MAEYSPKPWHTLITDHILDHEKCAVWSTMGSGKTGATLTALDGLFLAGEEPPALAIGPLRVARDVWSNEACKWDHLKHMQIVRVMGSEPERLRAVQRKGHLHTINYENVPWLVDYWGERWPYGIVIGDEATKLKSYRGSMQLSKNGKEFIRAAGSMRARALGRIAHTHIKRFIELTGTPSPNGLKDLWGQVWFLDAGKRLGRTFEGFRNRWFQRGFDGPYAVEPLPFAQEQIQDKLRDICLSIDMADYIDIKAPFINNIYVDLPPKARQHYADMEKEMFTQIEGHEIEAFGAAARTQKCLQIANGAAYLDPSVSCDSDKGARQFKVVHDEKIEALASCVEDANGTPMIVSYEFKSDKARIRKAFPDAVDLAESTGMNEFLGGKAMIGLGHPMSIGHGIDGLQSVSNIITFFGHNWDLEKYDQIIGRICQLRQLAQGKEGLLYINHIIARDTVDEMVMARRETKRSVQDILMDAMKARNVK